jgi:hypothetical protein
MLFAMALALTGWAPVAHAAESGTPDAASAPWLDLPGLAQGCDGIVRALLPLADGRIAVGGSFASCGGVAAANIAIWQPADGTFAPLGAGVGAGQAPVVPAVSALAVVGSGLFAGGSFGEAGGVEVRNIARFDLAASTWSRLGEASAEGVGGDVLALAPLGSDLYVGGTFAGAGNTQARHFARFDSAGQAWFAPPATPNGPVHALAAAGNRVFAAGDFTGVGTLQASRVARFDAGASAWSALGAGVSGTVHAIALRDGTLFAGGAFQAAGGVPANLLAAYSEATGAWTAVARSGAQGLDGGSLFLRSVRALAVAEGEVLASGDFTLADRSVARHVARVDPRTLAWYPLGSVSSEGMDGPGLAIATTGRRAIVGGGFRRAGGLARQGLAALLAPEGLFADGLEAAAPSP